MPRRAARSRLLMAVAAAAALALPPLLLRAEPDNWDRIRTTVEQMPQADRDRLNRNTADYLKLSEADRRRYRELHDILDEDERANRGQLRQTLEDYTAWLATTHAYDRQLLSQTQTPDQRVAEVERIVADRNEALARSRRGRSWLFMSFGTPDLTTAELDQVMSIVESGRSFNPDERRRLRDDDGNEKTGLARYFALFGILRDRGENLGPVLDQDLQRLLDAIPESKRPPGLDEVSDEGRRILCTRMIIGNVLQEFEQQVHQRAPSDAELRRIVKDWPQDQDSQRQLDEVLELEPADFRRALENQFAKDEFALDVDELRQMWPPDLGWGSRWGRRGSGDRSDDGPGDRGRRPFPPGPDGEGRFRDRPGMGPRFNRGGPPEGRGPDEERRPDGARGFRPGDRPPPPPDGQRRPPPGDEPAPQ